MRKTWRKKPTPSLNSIEVKDKDQPMLRTQHNRKDAMMYISNQDLQDLEGGLRVLIDSQQEQKQRHDRRPSYGNVRKKDFNELYAENLAKQREYEEEQKRAEQLWLKQREQRYATKGYYETKLIARPYVQFYAHAG